MSNPNLSIKNPEFVNFGILSKFDKLFILTEAMNIFKEKEVHRLIKHYSNKARVLRKQIKPQRIMSCYFGKHISNKICTTFKVPLQ